MLNIIYQGLRGARINKAQEIIIETRDSSDQPLCRGGENVTGFLKKPGMRPHPVSVQDRRDGTYLITFVPEIPGNIQLAVHINGKPMKVSVKCFKLYYFRKIIL